MQNYEFSEKLIMLRGSLGLTQDEFAERIGVSKRSVSAWENGVGLPKKTVRIKMAVTFGCPATYFLLDEEKPQAPKSELAAAVSEESELLDQLKYVIQNSNTQEQTKERYMDALYQTFNNEGTTKEK